MKFNITEKNIFSEHFRRRVDRCSVVYKIFLLIEREIQRQRQGARKHDIDGNGDDGDRAERDQHRGRQYAEKDEFYRSKAQEIFTEFFECSFHGGFYSDEYIFRLRSANFRKPLRKQRRPYRQTANIRNDDKRYKHQKVFIYAKPRQEEKSDK